MERLDKNDPEKIGPWQLIGRLGSGGMGEVFVATDGIQNVALKVFHKHLMRDRETRSRLQREIDTIARVKSQNVVKLISQDLNSTSSWIALEFINGPDLKTYVDKQGPLNLEHWIVLAKGLLNGLQDIHKVGVIHRDIKPSNIILTDYGIKIIDFGIAQSAESTSLTKTGLVAGSPAWLSPEQLHGTSLTFATDVFSAGAVLTFAASGISPWGDQTTTTTPAVINKILNKEPDLSLLNEIQLNIVRKMLIKDENSRISIQEILDYLESLKVYSSQPVTLIPFDDEKKEFRKIFSYKKKILLFTSIPILIFSIFFIITGLDNKTQLENSVLELPVTNPSNPTKSNKIIFTNLGVQGFSYEDIDVLKGFLSDDGNNEWSHRGCLDNSFKAIFDASKTIDLQRIDGGSWKTIQTISNPTTIDADFGKYCEENQAFAVEFIVEGVYEPAGTPCYRIYYPLPGTDPWSSSWCIYTE